MQTTYRLNANEIDISFIEKLKELFKNKEVSIKVEEINPPVNQYEIFKNWKHSIKNIRQKLYQKTLDFLRKYFKLP